MIGTKKKVVFLNPEKKPLEDLKLTLEEDGITIKIPALDKRWAERTAFSSYLGLVGSGGKIRTGADLEEWFHESKWFLEDMLFLLKLKHYEFWSHIIYQKAALGSVISFLKKATPFYLDINTLTTEENIITLYKDILAAVVRIICRIITNKESEEEWISREKLKELMYSNFLISIPMLLDLIVALGESNLNLLKKIFNTVFRIEPKYKNDLSVALRHFPVAFETLESQSDNDGLQGEDGQEFETPFDDFALYILDCSFTLSILLEVYPDARQICCDIKLAQSITHFYDNTIPYLYKNICVITLTAKSIGWLNEARLQFLRAFRSIVFLYIETVLSNPAESLMPSESFVSVMTECLADRLFVIDYQREYPIELDVEILKQACPELDDFKADFVAKGYKEEADSDSMNMIGNLQQLHLSDAEAAPIPSTSRAPPLSERQEPEGATSIDYEADKPSTSRSAMGTRKIDSTPSVRDVNQEVISVLDVFPHLGDGFVRRVLSRYDSSEDAIAAILEENLPPDLMNSDRSEVYIPPDPQDTLYQQTGIKRYNIFDGDKYDVMTQDNPECIIKIDKGFPTDPRNLSEMLDDKKALNEVRHRYQEYTLVEEGNEYDDEFDDSYEAVLESESRVVRSKQIKETLAEVEDFDDEDEPDDERQEENNGNNQENGETTDKRMNFCENPEDVRARYEARRAAKYGHNERRAPPPQAQKTKDVVGAPKGQGQEKQVVINRHKKDVNKSSRANHNRKAGAAFKRNKGMMS